MTLGNTFSTEIFYGFAAGCSFFELCNSCRSTRRHDLLEIVAVALCATIAGADSWMDVQRFGQARLT